MLTHVACTACHAASRPPWLSKPGLLDLASLRAYGCSQLRRLASALHSRTLPLGQPAVQAVVRQTVYHVGELTNEATPGRYWHTRWGSDALPALLHELEALAGELRDTPREQEAVGVLGEVRVNGKLRTCTPISWIPYHTICSHDTSDHTTVAHHGMYCCAAAMTSLTITP